MVLSPERGVNLLVNDREFHYLVRGEPLHKLNHQVLTQLGDQDLLSRLGSLALVFILSGTQLSA